MRRFLAVVLMVFGGVSMAGTMDSWAEWAYGELDNPLISTLELYRTDGMVLLDVGSDYAAYSNSASELTVEERESIGLVESKAGFVVRFDSCTTKENGNYLGGNISEVRIKKYIEEAPKLADEIRDLMAVSQKSFIPKRFGVSSVRNDQVFMMWIDGKGTTIELQINKDNHQLVWAAYKKCQEVNEHIEG